MRKWMNINKIALMVVFLMAPFSVRGETVLNQYQYQQQEYVGATILSNGQLVAGWHSRPQGMRGICFNIFDHDFSRRFSMEHRISSYANLSRGFVKLAASDDGFFAAAFPRWSSSDTTNMNVYLCKYNNNGDRLIGDTRVNDDTLGNHWAVSVLIDEFSDKIVVVWGANPLSNPDQRHYYLRQFDFDLNPLGGVVPLYTGNDESIIIREVGKLSPSRLIAVLNYGAWWGSGTVAMIQFDYDGANQTDFIVLSSYGDNNCSHETIAETPGGGVMVSWVAFDAIYEVGIWGRRIDANGDIIDTPEILLSVPDDVFDGDYILQNLPHAAYNEIGSVIALCWGQQRYVYSPSDLVGRFFDSELSPLSDSFTVSETGTQSYLPVVNYLGADSFVVCWEIYIQNTNLSDILGTIILPPQTDIVSERGILPEFQVNAYPNPFNAQTKIQYSLTANSHVTIEIYDILGRNIATLLDEDKYAGHHQVTWNAFDFPSGVYFARLETFDNTETIKMVLLK